MVFARSATRWFTSPPTAKSSANSKSANSRLPWPPVKFPPIAFSGARACPSGALCASWCSRRVRCASNRNPGLRRPLQPPHSPDRPPPNRRPSGLPHKRSPRLSPEKSRSSRAPRRPQKNRPPRQSRPSQPRAPLKLRQVQLKRRHCGSAFSGGNLPSPRRPPSRPKPSRPRHQAPANTLHRPRAWILPHRKCRRKLPCRRSHPAPPSPLRCHPQKTCARPQRRRPRWPAGLLFLRPRRPPCCPRSGKHRPPFCRPSLHPHRVRLPCRRCGKPFPLHGRRRVPHLPHPRPRCPPKVRKPTSRQRILLALP